MERKRLYGLLASSLLAVSLTLGGWAGIADSAEKPSKEGPRMKAPGSPTFPCPPGWHHVDDPNFPGACAPNKPNPAKCPPGYQWEDNGCTVGCRYVPG